MAEYIEREEAIKMLTDWREQRSDNLADLFHWTGIKAMLENVPPADVKPVVHGKWNWHRYHVWVCSQCGENPTKGMGYVQSKDELFKYCPNCGADMRAKEVEL